MVYGTFFYKAAGSYFLSISFLTDFSMIRIAMASI